MSALQPRNSGALSAGGAGDLSSVSSRRSATTRAISRTHEQGLVRAAAVEVEEVLAEHKTSAVASVSERAATSIALLSSLENQLAMTTPTASGRLATLADITSLQITETVADTAAKLRRM